MPINDPVKEFHGERDAGPHHGGRCPLCGLKYDSNLADHLPTCEEKP